MFKSLYSRLALVLFGVFLTMGVLLFWFFEQASIATQNEASQRLHKDFAKSVVKDLGITNGDEFDPERIQEAFQQIMIIGPSLELYIVDKNGKLIAYEAEEGKIKRHKVDLAPIISFVEGNENYPIMGDDPRSTKTQKIFSAARVYSKDNQILNQAPDDEGIFVGYLYAIIGGEDYDSVLTSLRSSKTWKISLIGITSGLLFLLLASLLLFYALTRPLRKLTKEIKAFEDSDFKEINSSHLLQKNPQGEFNQLKNSFYQMERRIAALIERLNKHDEIRREFLAYLSHDLRTPLAGIKAYIETIELKKDAMPLAERQNFLQKALINSDRLEGMINELFELTRIESNQIELNNEEFVIGDLLSDISVSLENKVMTKDIKLIINCDDPQAQVFGDIAKIERVIQNLVENAVRYSTKGSDVILRTRGINNEEMLIEVIDSGSGISEHHLPYIFEPYYRASDEQKLNHKGAGLGLAICHRLLALQGTQLQVESTLGKGTIFSFKLNLQK